MTLFLSILQLFSKKKKRTAPKEEFCKSKEKNADQKNYILKATATLYTQEQTHGTFSCLINSSLKFKSEMAIKNSVLE